ncbi:MAG: PEP-CTERM sorting domain-containing protein [Acidobacteriota bacterium]|nr:PEP-CTERM sorting domain-containing protein [Acidobacteriota bacterium]
MTVIWVCGLLCIPSQAAKLSFCNGTTFTCTIYEETNIDISALGGAISGDVILLDGSTVSDVFRIYNDFVNTGGGTGIGFTASLFSLDEGNLPSPATYSSNAVVVRETGNITLYSNNGDTYKLLDSPTPEPSTLALFAAGGLVLLAAVKLRRSV